MGRRAVGEASAWSLALVRAVASLRESAELTNQQVLDRTGMSASYYYARMRGDAPFDTNDIEKLAAAFDTHPHEISRIAASSEGADASIDPHVHTDAVELARRLTAITAAPRGDGSAFDAADLVHDLAGRGIPFTVEEWEDLLAGQGGPSVRSRVLTATAAYTNIDDEYLLDLDDDSAREHTEAQFEFRSALRDSGADSLAARSVGDVSPSALRAIARSLRSIASTDSGARS